ncbi:MAG: XdhC family protein [Rhodobacteraceae bacterium]|nr:XdhC family protein [Paracoccaceae bacterium]
MSLVAAAAPVPGALADPVAALVGSPGAGVLAVIAGVEGPSYRPVGAMMAVLPGDPDPLRVGTLSSGCVERDIALQAMRAQVDGRPQVVRYGRGSAFLDIQLPCGGGLDIALIPDPDRAVLARLRAEETARRPVSLSVDLATGALALGDMAATARTGDRLVIARPPETRFLIFGKGPEAEAFAALVQAAGFPAVLLSPDPETLETPARAGLTTRVLPVARFPGDLAPDPWTAVVLFFHDHDWEPPILAQALATPAFYVGAQGSRRSAEARAMALQAMGVPEAALLRLRGPIGLVPSARDARTLAVSVLAEVLAARGNA